MRFHSFQKMRFHSLQKCQKAQKCSGFFFSLKYKYISVQFQTSVEFQKLFRQKHKSCAVSDSETIKRERIFKFCALEFEEEEEEIMIIEEEEEEEIGRRKALPQDILMEILSWLPAKSLVSSFKFVCKDWRSLIQDSDFIKMHLNRRRTINGDGETSLMRKPKCGKALFQLHPHLNCDKPPFIFEDLPISVATKLDFDFDILPSNSRMLSLSSRKLSWMTSVYVDYDSSCSRLVGSLNGLLCLSVNNNESLIILNPTTKKRKISPRELIECPNDFTFDDNVAYGFGSFHNSTTTMDEYKVVRIAFFYPHNDDDLSRPLQINIYSMSSNSWRKVKDIPPRRNFGFDSSGVFLNGVVHWMGCNHGYSNYPYIWDTIVCFNIRDEVFGVQIPMAPCVDVVVHGSDDVILMNWRGYLGMIYCSRTERMDIDLEIWVMKEYGIGESWIREFVIRTSDSDLLGELPAGFLIESRSIMTCFWTGDQILIVGKYLLVVVAYGCSNVYKRYGRWVLYDLNKKKINEDFLMADIPCEHWQQQFDYIDTLVSLKSSLFPLSNNRKRKN